MDRNMDVPERDSTTSGKSFATETDTLIGRYYEEKLLTVDVGIRKILLPQALLFENSAAKLPIGSIHLRIDQKYPLYTPPAAIASIVERLLSWQQHMQGTMLTNSTTMRLNRVAIQQDSITFFIAKASYFDYIATNFSIDVKLNEWDSSLREIVHPTARLCPLETSALANHIGVSALVFTKDHFLVLPMRSRKGVNIWQDSVHTSISGATNFEKDCFDGVPHLIATLLREGKEELGVQTDDFEQDSVVFLGATRELLRGGKPEVFFAAKLNLSAAQVIERTANAQDRLENHRIELFAFQAPFTDGIDGKEQQTHYVLVMQDIQRLLQQYESHMSLPAMTNLLLYLKYHQQPSVIVEKESL